MPDRPQIRFLRDRLGHSVAFAEHGNGPLVICPVWWVSHVEQDWAHEAFRNFFCRLGQGLQVVRYDRPGVGLSDRDVGARSIQDEVDLLDDLVAELGCETYSLFAISCAGPIAIHHAARHPQRVEKIVFCGSYLEGTEICPIDVQDAVRSTVRAHWGMGSRAIADIFFPDGNTETIKDFARQTRAAASSETADELLSLTYAMSAGEAAHKVQADCLVIHRSGDRAIPFESGRSLVKAIRNAKLVMLDGRNHPPWIDGDEIAAIANAFLRGGNVPSDSFDRADLLEPNDHRPSSGCFLDETGRCLNIDGKDITLTPLEYGVMSMLVRNVNKVVTRDDLLSEVWQQPYEGSNRVDVVVSALRRKLGNWSPSIGTVTGHGYRFKSWKRKK